MPIALRHRNERMPSLPSLHGLAVHHEPRAEVMARLQQRALPEIQARMDEGHRAYVATVHGAPAAWGWVATATASIGELRTSFTIARHDRYLWNFVTLPAFRGQGVYPRLLDAIVRMESTDGERFWIIYAPENHASGAGIRKAGFTVIAELSFDHEGTPVVKEISAGGATAASRMLGLEEIAEAVAQCWKCARGAVPEKSSCSSGVACSCDYQRPEVPCAG